MERLEDVLEGLREDLKSLERDGESGDEGDKEGCVREGWGNWRWREVWRRVRWVGKWKGMWGRMERVAWLKMEVSVGEMNLLLR